MALERVFTVRCHDAVTAAIGPKVIADARAQAPGVAIRLLAEASTDTNELRHGQIDLEIGSAEPALPDVNHRRIGDHRLVAALRPDHPLATGPLTAARFAAVDHIIVSRRGRLADPIDDRLAAMDLRRRVVASAPTSTAALHIVADSDLIVAVPETICGPMLRTFGLVTRQLPFELAAVPLHLAWHHRYDNDKAHQWLRSTVEAACTAVGRGQAAAEH